MDCRKPVSSYQYPSYSCCLLTIFLLHFYLKSPIITVMNLQQFWEAQSDFLVLMGLGLAFIILGVIGILLGMREESSYFNKLAERPGDVKEFVEQPHWPQFTALRVGGWIAIAVGVVLLGIGLVLWYSGRM